MATRPDPWHQALAQSHSTGEASGLSFSASSPTETMERLEPTRGHRGCITELSLRFPCPRDTDPDAYRIRLEYLVADTAHLPVPLLRRACQRVSQSARGLPYASEIIEAAAEIVNQRAAAEKRTDPARASAQTTREGRLSETARSYNRDNAMKGSPIRWTDDMQSFSIGDPGEKRRTDIDGAVVWP